MCWEARLCPAGRLTSSSDVAHRPAPQVRKEQDAALKRMPKEQQARQRVVNLFKLYADALTRERQTDRQPADTRTDRPTSDRRSTTAGALWCVYVCRTSNAARRQQWWLFVPVVPSLPCVPMLRRYDVDGSGSIELDEFQLMLKDLCCPMNTEEAKNAFDAMDTRCSPSLAPLLSSHSLIWWRQRQQRGCRHSL